MSRPRLFCSEPLSCCTKGNCRDGSRCQYPCCDVSGKGTRRYTTIRLPTNADIFFVLQLSSRIFGSSLLRQNLLSFQHLLRAIRIRITEIWRSILAPMENTSMTSFLTRFCLKANQETKKIMISIPFENFRIIRLPRRQRKGERKSAGSITHTLSIEWSR